jgi:hypothetical protein
MLMDGYLKVGLLALVVVLPTACTAVVTEGPVVALGAQLSVERFLQASNEYDVRSMGRLFGTSDGSAMETGGPLGCAFKKIGSWFGGLPCVQRSEVEIRMEAIAQILQHSDYQVVGEQRVAGRTSPARRVLVNMTTLQGALIREVPFVVVQTSGGRWLIEQVNLELVMAAS